MAFKNGKPFAIAQRVWTCPDILSTLGLFLPEQIDIATCHLGGHFGRLNHSTLVLYQISTDPFQLSKTALNIIPELQRAMTTAIPPESRCFPKLGVSENSGFSPQNHPNFNSGFSIIFTINHPFWGFSPLFLVQHPNDVALFFERMIHAELHHCSYYTPNERTTNAWHVWSNYNHHTIPWDERYVCLYMYHKNKPFM